MKLVNHYLKHKRIILKIMDELTEKYWRKCYDHDIWHKGFGKFTSLMSTEINELFTKMLNNNEINQETFKKYTSEYNHLKQITKKYE